MMKEVNGFRMEDITKAVEGFQNRPETAEFEWRVRNKWVKGGHNRSVIQDFYGGMQEDTTRAKAWELDNGEPPILLGGNEGPNPVEFVLHALAGCMTTTMVLHAAAHGIAIDSVESTLKGDWNVRGMLGMDPGIRSGYQNITVQFRITGDLTEDQRKELVRYTTMSPVFDIVSNPVPVSVDLDLV
ncbi:MAG: OsmC family protein [Flavobacteriales bacterium]|nr:OsmC family protein [Flavobacteriales bacterium]